MSACRFRTFTVLLLFLLPCRPDPSLAGILEGIPSSLRQILVNGGGALALSDRSIPAATLNTFYAERDYLPMWVGDGIAEERAQVLIQVLNAAGDEGLDPANYALPPSAAGATDGVLLAEREALLSASLIRYAEDVGRGRFAPKTIDPQHFIPAPPVDPRTVLEGAAEAESLNDYLLGLAPASNVYRGLRDALRMYRQRQAQDSWVEVPGGPKLEPGMADPRVPLLRARLRRSEHLPVPDLPSEVYDPDLEQAVRNFQRRHGLLVDGIVGDNTLRALNVAPAMRIRQILVNMERWRWMPEDLGDRHVLVNMAGFELDYVENGDSVLNMRVVVGKPYRQTPAFSGRISHLQFHPYWTVPRIIAVEDLLPKFSDNPDLLVEDGFRVFEGPDDDSEIDPSSIDWLSLGRNNFPYRLRQDPGPKNALGRVKFMFPNQFAIYMHDTPSRSLFERSVRSFSSGCIRVEKPVELAVRLLEHKNGWDLTRINAAIDSGETVTVGLPKPVPVHLTYLTAWTAEDGEVHFRSDLYGRDRRIAQALFQHRS
jgi:murein L,D-transpeptidase YcbB/YkuD